MKVKPLFAKFVLLGITCIEAIAIYGLSFLALVGMMLIGVGMIIMVGVFIYFHPIISIVSLIFIVSAIIHEHADKIREWCNKQINS